MKHWRIVRLIVIGPYDCEFEAGGTCHWEFCNEQPYPKWYRETGPTTSSGTGPKNDHTSGSGAQQSTSFHLFNTVRWLQQITKIRCIALFQEQGALTRLLNRQPFNQLYSFLSESYCEEPLSRVFIWYSFNLLLIVLNNMIKELLEIKNVDLLSTRMPKDLLQ